PRPHHPRDKKIAAGSAGSLSSSSFWFTKKPPYRDERHLPHQAGFAIAECQVAAIEGRALQEVPI
ncbi:hypothetical protein HN011_002157, partial [Eciton burchellii]